MNPASHGGVITNLSGEIRITQHTNVIWIACLQIFARARCGNQEKQLRPLRESRRGKPGVRGQPANRLEKRSWR